MTAFRVWAGRGLLSGLTPIVVYGSRFAGNIILSRLLAPNEFGTAIAISVVLSIGGLATDMALDRFVMIDGSTRALSTAHLVAVVNGVFLAALLVFSAPIAAGIFGVGNFAGSFALAAGVSAVGAFANLGVKQMQRNYYYGREAAAQVTANVLGILGLLVAATVFRNHHAIIVGIGLQSATYVLLSHVLAPSPYRFSYDKVMLFRALSFGLPLTLNGIGLAVMSQLDRVLVGSWFGVKELGLYAVMISMSVIPTSLIVTVFSNPSLSFLLSDGQDTSNRAGRYQLLLTFYSLVTGLYACWMVLTLDVLIPLIFGPSFSISTSAHVLLVLIACLRLQRSGAPTSLLLASGRTKQLALLNLSVGLGLLVAVPCMAVWPSLEAILVGITIGELASCTIFFTTLGNAVTPGRQAVTDLLRVVAVPAVMAAALAWKPYPTWDARGLLLLISVVAVLVQLSVELYRNSRFRTLIARSSIGRRLQGDFAATER